MRMRLVLASLVVLSLQGCTTTDSAKEDKGEKKAPEESWAEKTGKNAEKEAKKLKEKGMPYYAACKTEVEKFCKAEEKEYKQLFECMKKNKDKFTPACKTAVESYMKEHK